MRPSVHCVVALLPEARPFLEHWKLSASETEPFRLFEGEYHRLVVSGVGPDRAREATRWLAVRYPDPRAVWLNVGSCGHPTLAPGEIRTAHRVVDASSGEAWYPPLIARSPWGASFDLRTVDAPERDYAEEVGYDMEAAGFLAAARPAATAELVQVVKIVSDNREAPARRLRPAELAGLVRRHVEAIDRFVEGLRALAAGLPTGREDDELLAVLTGKAHFTVSRRRRLRDLLGRARALGLVVDPEDLGEDADGMLRDLQRRIEASPLHLGGPSPTDR